MVGWLNISPGSPISLRRKIAKDLAATLTSVRMQYLVVVVRPTPSCQQKYRRSHISLVSRAAGHVGHGHLFQLGLLIGSRRTRRHLGREDARRQHVDANARLCESGGKHAAQMQESGLGSGVGYMTVGRVFEQGGIAARVDDAGCISRGGAVAFDKQGQEGHGHEKASGAIGLECFGPMLWF